MTILNYLIEATGEYHDPDIINYGCIILVDGIITTATIVFLGLFSHRLINSVIFWGCSVLGITTFGGYHCNTRKRCFSLTIILWAITMYTEYISSCFLLFPQYIIAICVTGVAVYLVAPVVNENKSVPDAIWRKNRKKSLLLELFSSILIIIFRFIDWNIAGTLLINKVEIVILMLMGRSKRMYAERKKRKMDN